MRKPNYDKHPFVAVPDSEQSCVEGWEAIGGRLREAILLRGNRKTVMAVECYPGVDETTVARSLAARLQPALLVSSADGLLPEVEINRICEPFLGGDDPVFGFLSSLTLPQFFDPAALQVLRESSDAINEGLVLIVGVGATLLCDSDILVYADLARWEIQQRQRRKEISNLGVNHFDSHHAGKYKRAYFIDWRVADRWKKPLLGKAEFFLDTHQIDHAKLADGDSVRLGLVTAARRPFRVVPLFDPGVWGGQWMKEVCDLDRTEVNYAWCFDCVPEENSLLLGFGKHRFELPSIDLVFDQGRALLGQTVQSRFGDEFPIRFDFLDTMGGGNLSFQVHPRKEYIREKFGMPYTQDESYYLLDAGRDAKVYLGLKDGVDPESMLTDLKRAQEGEIPFPDERYVNRFPAKKHDHFLIPSGTVHCSGSESMVLEISATPYIFTFKMWDWNRLGLDGKARPIHLEHGASNIDWSRNTEWTKKNLVNRVETLGCGEGWREERTGLHESDFIETRRHWFTKTVAHDTQGTLNVLNLVEGEEAIVESPTGTFDPFVVHYAESFVVPASVGPYTIRPHGKGIGHECATLKAYVRE
ncbi:class I mannose-6-phosphate isomerase [Luteolibacter arcticus]|uniref:Class I mannose-6-phosphate isomerase n=1 Tax=Luteolibacter arcticus TaxID=1581411 RepID=A0ABT3GHY5_9BACT|nr:class I mannose-6-phosphate isomerase [Luteolibacter arcticus]MCW1923133.1 class I mannose-6-phosphate isomerase [Luteolibacter arcticus]